MGRFAVYFALLIFIYGLSSCEDDTDVGSGLLSSEDLEVVFTDDFNIVMRHVAPAPINLSLVPLNSLGTLNNPTFGKFTSSFYVRPIIGSGVVPPDFGGGSYDSVVLALKVDTSRYYGNPEAFFDIDVFELSESIDFIDTLRSDQVFLTNPEPLGSVSRLVPARLDSIITYNASGDTTYFQDVITIPLNRRFGGAIFADTANNADSENFLTLLNGFFVRCSSNNSLLQVNISHEVSSLLFYYKDTAGVSISYPYRFSSSSPLNFSYDLSGSQLESALKSPSPELFYLQGHAGTIIEIDIEDVLKLNDPFINHASFEIYAENSGIIDTSLFPLPVALDLLRLNDNGELISVIDLGIGQDQGQTRGIFDGESEEDSKSGLIKYEMNITAHVKEIFKGRQSTKMFIVVRNRTLTPNNLIFYGPNHPDYPARLKLTHTKL